MIRWLLIFFFLTKQVVSLAQGKQDANWVFGVKAGIDFSDTAHLQNINTLANNFVGAASISDSSGNLLFYMAPDTPFSITNDSYVDNSIYDRNNNVIVNGSGLKVGTNLNNAIFLPLSKDASKYILFYTFRIDTMIGGNHWIFDRLYSCKIIKNINSYEAIGKNTLVSNIPVEWRLAAVRHANGKDWWLLAHESPVANNLSSNNYLSLLVSGDSIAGPDTQSIGSVHNSQDLFFGQMNFSRDGTRLVSALDGQNNADLFDFNCCTGQLSNFVSIHGIDSTNVGGDICGAEFSMDGKHVYISEDFANINGPSGRNAVYQYSLDTGDVNLSRKVLWIESITNFNSIQFNFGYLKRAPNEKIYLAVGGTFGCCPYNSIYNQYNQHLWVVNNPDSTGLACDFQPYGYHLGDSARSYFSLPNMPNYNLGPISVYAADAGQDVTLCKDTAENITLGVPAVPNVVYHWQPSGGLSDTSVAQPTADPDTDTYYSLTVVDTSQTGTSCDTRTDTVFVHVVQKCGVGIGEVSGQSVKVYPNPTSYRLTVELPNPDGETFRLYDLVGRLVIEKRLDSDKVSVDVSSVPNGLYIYRIDGQAGKVQVAR